MVQSIRVKAAARVRAKLGFTGTAPFQTGGVSEAMIEAEVQRELQKRGLA